MLKEKMLYTMQTGQVKGTMKKWPLQNKHTEQDKTQRTTRGKLFVMYFATKRTQLVVHSEGPSPREK